MTSIARSKHLVDLQKAKRNKTRASRKDWTATERESNNGRLDLRWLASAKSTLPKAECGSSMNYNIAENVPPIWQVGDVILDRYEVKQVFTGGGMGLVYRVHHRDWDMDLAVKSPRPEFLQSEQQIKNFEREAETWVDLGLHPHIVSCYYVRRLGGVPRIFAEFVEGGTLSDSIRSERLYNGGPEKALERVIDVAIQSAWGLHYAHEKGLVHQDVKPGNVLMLPDGTAKVSDFGLATARYASAENTTVAARTGQSILVPGSGFMTPEYASPEQLRGEHLSRKTDVWSWAVSLLELLLGELTWASGIAAPAALEDIDDGRLDEEIVALLDSCFGSRSHPRWTSFDAVIQSLTSYYASRFGAYYRPAPRPAELLADALNNRAASLVDLNQMDEASRVLNKAIELDPRHTEVAYNRGVLLWRSARGTDHDLLARIEDIRYSKPNDWKVAYLSGLVHLERCDFLEAVRSLREATRLGGSNEVLMALKEALSLTPNRAGYVRTFEGHTASVKSVCLSSDWPPEVKPAPEKAVPLEQIRAEEQAARVRANAAALAGHEISGPEPQPARKVPSCSV